MRKSVSLLSAQRYERPRAERVLRAAVHAVRILRGEVRIELLERLALLHFGRRKPLRPMLLVVDLGLAGPGEAGLADADAVAERVAVVLDEIEELVGGVDDHRPRFLAGDVGRRRHRLPEVLRVDLGDRNRRDLERLALDRAVRLQRPAGRCRWCPWRWCNRQRREAAPRSGPPGASCRRLRIPPDAHDRAVDPCCRPRRPRRTERPHGV